MRLGEFTSRQLSLMSRSQELTPFMILLAAWLALLSRYSGQKEVGVGTVVANRGRAELRTLIGPVSNTLLIKVDFSGNPSLREILRSVREAAIDAFEHKEHNPSVHSEIGKALSKLGFHFSVNDKVYRLNGGLTERLRFLLLVSPFRDQRGS